MDGTLPCSLAAAEGMAAFALEVAGCAAFALVFAGCGAIITEAETQALGAVGVALVFGLVIMVMVYATGHLSGAHINPAVTVAFTLTRHFPARDAVAYIGAQVRGAIAGAFALLAMWPARPAGLGATIPAIDVGRRSRLRDRDDGDPDVRDPGRGHRRARGGDGRRDRDRRDDRAGCALRRAPHRRLDEPGALARARARRRRVPGSVDLLRRASRRGGHRRLCVPTGARDQPGPTDTP